MLVRQASTLRTGSPPKVFDVFDPCSGLSTSSTLVDSVGISDLSTSSAQVNEHTAMPSSSHAFDCKVCTHFALG